MIELNDLGSFDDINAVWKKYPEGGKEGDYLTIRDVKYRWNKYDRMWVSEDKVIETPARRTETFYGDVAIHHDLIVAGTIRAKRIKQPYCGMFASVEALQMTIPNPSKGMWAIVGDTVPAPIYRCDEDGTWTPTGATGGTDAGANIELRATEEYIQWKYVWDTEWTDLVSIADLHTALVQEPGNSKELAMSQYAVTKALNEINDVLFSQYTALTFSRTPSVIERGVNTKVTLTWNPTFNGAYEKPSALTVKKGGTTLTTDTSLKTIQDTAGITETTTYSIEATIKGIKKTASATVNAYYPMYFGGSASEEITSEELLALTKQSIKSSPAGQVTIPLTTGQYLWLCVPEGMSINGVGILNSSPVGLIAPVTVSVPNKGNYRCYRSDSAMIRDTNDTYIIN